MRDVPRIAGTSIAVILNEASSTRIGGRKILLGELVVDNTDGVCGIVCGSAIDGVLLAGQPGNRQTQRTSN